jgi:hypothetical protein
MFSLNSEDSYLEQFYILAEIILNHGNLKIGQTLIQITEIEFYYKTPSMHKSPHQDPFVHCDKDQLTQGRFIFIDRTTVNTKEEHTKDWILQ